MTYLKQDYRKMSFTRMSLVQYYAGLTAFPQGESKKQHHSRTG